MAATLALGQCNIALRKILFALNAINKRYENCLLKKNIIENEKDREWKREDALKSSRKKDDSILRNECLLSDVANVNAVTNIDSIIFLQYFCSPCLFLRFDAVLDSLLCFLFVVTSCATI